MFYVSYLYNSVLKIEHLISLYIVTNFCRMLHIKNQKVLSVEDNKSKIWAELKPHAVRSKGNSEQFWNSH